MLISPIAVFEMSSLSLTVVPTMNYPFGFVVSAYLKKESRPSFADFTQSKVVAQYGGAVFNQIDAGQWFILIYNDGPDLDSINIGVNLEGKSTEVKNFAYVCHNCNFFRNKMLIIITEAGKLSY